MNRITAIASIAAVVIIAVLAVLLAFAKADLSTAESDNRVLKSDNALQGKVIATQAFNVNRFNQVAQLAASANAVVAGDAEKTLLNTGRFFAVRKPVICLFLLTLLAGCSSTPTVYVPAQCTPIPASLIQPMLVPLPPEG